MWGTIANLKENLNKIALDVHEGDSDDDEELTISGSGNGDVTSVSDRRNSHRFAKSVSRSPLPNGIDLPRNPEVFLSFQNQVSFVFIHFCCFESSNS